MLSVVLLATWIDATLDHLDDLCGLVPVVVGLFLVELAGGSLLSVQLRFDRTLSIRREGGACLGFLSYVGQLRVEVVRDSAHSRRINKSN